MIEKGKMIERLPVFAASASSVLYVLGFIVVTSYLASHGVYDQSLLNAKYILAGSLIAVVMLAYYFFVWRKVADQILNGMHSHSKLSGVSQFLLVGYYVVEHAFACLFTALMLLTLLGLHEYSSIQTIVFLTFGIDLFLQKSGCYAKFPKVSFSLTFFLNGVVFIACFVFGYVHQPLSSLIAIFLTVTLAGTVVITSEGWRVGGEKYYGIFFISLYVVLGVIGFGATVYEHISPKYGGALPVKVQVHLDQDVADDIKKIFSQSGENVFLVVESSDYSTFRLGELGDGELSRFITLDRDLVKAVLFQSPSNKAEYIKGGQSLKSATEEIRRYFQPSNDNK